MTSIESAYARYSTGRFPLPEEATLNELEERIHVSFPDDYRRFVLGYNGGYFSEPAIDPPDDNCPQDSLGSLHGIGATHWIAELGESTSLSLFDDNDPPQIVPIGRTVLGALIILVVVGEESGCILLKQAFGDFYFLADGIEEFFSLLREPDSQIE